MKKCGIARQQWRARIETLMTEATSFALKSIARQQWRARIETQTGAGQYGVHHCIARQQWRARIETLQRHASRMPLKHRPPAMAGAD